MCSYGQRESALASDGKQCFACCDPLSQLKQQCSRSCFKKRLENAAAFYVRGHLHLVALNFFQGTANLQLSFFLRLRIE